jgi:hypothetical protein
VSIALDAFRGDSPKVNPATKDEPRPANHRYGDGDWHLFMSGDGGGHGCPDKYADGLRGDGFTFREPDLTVLLCVGPADFSARAINVVARARQA